MGGGLAARLGLLQLGRGGDRVSPRRQDLRSRAGSPPGALPRPLAPPLGDLPGQHFQLPLDHLHEPASRVEHYLGAGLQEQLDADLDRPGLDPHGRTIPPEP